MPLHSRSRTPGALERVVTQFPFMAQYARATVRVSDDPILAPRIYRGTPEEVRAHVSRCKEQGVLPYSLLRITLDHREPSTSMERYHLANRARGIKGDLPVRVAIEYTYPRWSDDRTQQFKTLVQEHIERGYVVETGELSWKKTPVTPDARETARLTFQRTEGTAHLWLYDSIPKRRAWTMQWLKPLLKRKKHKAPAS